MSNPEDKFEIEFLDHVAIRVKDLKVSAEWYEKVLGLKKYQMSQWGDTPVFMLANKSGIALFPANLSDKELDLKSKNINIDHFAFNVTRKNFEKAKKRYEKLKLDFNIRTIFIFIQFIQLTRTAIPLN